MDYIVGYRYHGDMEMRFFRFTADDAEHAIEQFRNLEPNEQFVVVFVVMI